MSKRDTSGKTFADSVIKQQKPLHSTNNSNSYRSNTELGGKNVKQKINFKHEEGQLVSTDENFNDSDEDDDKSILERANESEEESKMDCSDISGADSFAQTHISKMSKFCHSRMYKKADQTKDISDD